MNFDAKLNININAEKFPVIYIQTKVHTLTHYLVN